MRRLATAAVALAALLPLCCSRSPRRAVVGIILPQENHVSVELALREINAAGGIRGVPLEAMGLERRVPLNAPFDPAGTLRTCGRFADAPDLLAVIGPSDSTSTLSAAATLNRRQVPEIVTIATHPSITNIGDWVYRLCISDAAQGPALAEYVVRDWGKRRVAIIQVNDDYGRGLAQRFEARLRELGGTTAAVVPHRDQLQADDVELIRSTLADLKRDPDLDLLFLIQRAPAAGPTFQAIRDAGLKTDILAGDNFDRFFFQTRDRAPLEGIRFSAFFRPDLDAPRVRSYVQKYRQLTGLDPDYGQAFAYDAVYLVRDAIEAGGFSRAGVKAHLDRLIRERTLVHGATGPYRLGSDHDGRRSLYIVEVHGGRLQLLKSLAVD